MDDKGQIRNIASLKKREDGVDYEQIVLEKGIFSNVFEKDIRRVYIYKKSERIAKAIHMISPAFKDSKALRDRVQRVSIEIIDASILPPAESKDILARELLTLGSVLRMARAAGILSPMNADIIMREAHNLLQEVSSYEEPKVALDEVPTLAALAKSVPSRAEVSPMPIRPMRTSGTNTAPVSYKGQADKGHNGDKKDKNGRRDAILSILKSKGPSYIKDLSILIREVSEKTIQRELQALVAEGKVTRTGERRWTTYTLAGAGTFQPSPITVGEASVDFAGSEG
ncbi:MAG TPA: hypothetical protein PK109_03025 [Candidatus Paceibacterota bacterium]|nr:hypothetical protein [Candidatus Paceibacterota bacterium]